MKFALLGTDVDCLELVTAIARSPSHELVAVYAGESGIRQDIQQLAPAAKWSDNWESLLHEPLAEAVIVAPWRDRSSLANQHRADQLRKLVQASMPLIIVHPGCESILGFEVDMIREDTKSLVLPYCPADSWIPLQEMLESLAGSSSQQAEQLFIQTERRMNQSPDELRMQLARDVFQLGPLLGRVLRVNAFGTALRGGPNRLTVHLDGEAGCAAQWSFLSPAAAENSKVHVTSTAGSVSATRLSENQWRIEHAAESRVVQVPNLAEQLVRDITTRIQAPPGNEWSSASRSQEVTELAERSAERGRTLELHHEDHSEEETFKGVMAVGSCGVLMLTLLILIVGSVIEGIRLPYIQQAVPSIQGGPDSGSETTSAQPPVPRTSLWIRLWPVYPIAIFLLLQSLRLAFPAKHPSKSESSAGKAASIEES